VSDQHSVDVHFEDGRLVFDHELMIMMWGQVNLRPYLVNGTYSFEYKGEVFGIVDLLCYLDELHPDLRAKGPEAIIEAILELINSVYLGDEEMTLIGRCLDLYAVEMDDGRNCLVFRTMVLDAGKTVEEMLMLREVAKELFPIPQPE
jgi:hypothetical protein